MADNETIADIIAEMRQGMNPNGTAECQYLESDICMLADRLEAAHKLERGDCAKLREALNVILGKFFENGYGQNRAELDDNDKQMILAALARPVKNCEIGTAREQAKRFAEYCDSETCKRNRCKFNAKALCIERCALAWAQLPYEEGGAK